MIPDLDRVRREIESDIDTLEYLMRQETDWRQARELFRDIFELQMEYHIFTMGEYYV